MSEESQGKDLGSAADPANPTSTGRVGGKGGVSTAGKTGEGVRQPEGFEGGVTHEGEDVWGEQEMGSHIKGVRKGEEREAHQGKEAGHQDRGSTGAGRPAGGQDERYATGANTSDQKHGDSQGVGADAP